MKIVYFNRLVRWSFWPLIVKNYKPIYFLLKARPWKNERRHFFSEESVRSIQKCFANILRFFIEDGATSKWLRIASHLVYEGWVGRIGDVE